MRHVRSKALILRLASACIFGQLFSTSARSDDQFDNYEIRVIRPKYFSKSKRLETGAQMTVIMNQSFIYSYLATGVLDFHLTEAWAIEGSASYGFSFDKEDKRELKSRFKINTLLLRTEYIAEAAVLYTPIYGKYQLSSGRLIYFDTFVSAGGGMTGIDYQFDHCPDPSEVPEKSRASVKDPPPRKTVAYPTVMAGLGQRIFYDKKYAFRWDVRGHIFGYDTKDGSCNPATANSETKTQTNITVQLGASYYL
jgi:outer membrane beta-barrel protein